jgi:pyrroline-5-carboxylate reductase
MNTLSQKNSQNSEVEINTSNQDSKTILTKFKIGFIGAGNMSQSIIGSLKNSQLIPLDRVFLSNRSEKKLLRVSEELGVKSVATNEELVENCDIVVLAVKPQDLGQAIESIANTFQPHHIVMSLAAGIQLKELKKMVPQVKQWVRIMPNTPVSIEMGVIGYCQPSPDPYVSRVVEALFSPLGIVEKVDEGEMFEALMVATSSGVGFVLEMMTYWQEWLVEHGFSDQKARELTVQTFLGTAQLATLRTNHTLEDLQAKVTSKKGVTAAGLESMRELEIERAIRYSFEKAVLRDREMAQQKY